MSADNTIGILITNRRDGQAGFEYRVAHRQAIENIEFEPDYPSAEHAMLNREYVREYFGDVPILHSLEDAHRAARRLEKKIGYVEYGIRILDFAGIHFPTSDRRRKRRRHQRRHDRQAQPAC